MGDADRTPSGLSGGSRALAVGGAALYEAGRTIMGKGTQLAAHLLEVSAQDVIFADGVFRVPGTDLRLDVFAVAKAARDPARLPAGMEPGLDTKHRRGLIRSITAYRHLRPFPTAATLSRSKSTPIPAPSQS